MTHDTPREPPADWLKALDAADADVAAGRTVPLATVLADLQASFDRMEARQFEKAPSAIKA